MKDKNHIVAGRNIFLDDKGRTVLYVKSSKTGYVIQEKDKKNYNLYSNRYVLSFSGGVLASTFNIPILYCLAIILATVAFLEYRYRYHFLSSLVQLTNFTPKNNLSTLDSMVAANEKKKNLLLGILYFVFGVLIILNGLQMKVSSFVMGGYIIVAIAAAYMGIMNLIAFSKIKNWK